MQVVIGYTVGVAAMLLAFKLTPPSMVWGQWASVFMIGFFLYGPQACLPSSASPDPSSEVQQQLIPSPCVVHI